MHAMPLIYALLLNRSPDWTIERAVQLYAPVPARVSLRQILLACL